MTSKQRHEARYLRRKEKRLRKLHERNKEFKDVFSYTALFRAYKRSIQGVGWKPSTQTYKANAAMNVYNTHKKIMDDTWKTKGFVHFTIMERGKLRHIRSVHISERVVQHALCDELLTPAITPSLICDNSGSIKGKGMEFALNRCKRKLQRATRKANDVYVLTYDFRHYFDEIDHATALSVIDRFVLDERCRSFSKRFVNDFGKKGLGLGSQISQILAIAIPNPIDQKLQREKDVLGYGRYMDDGYVIAKDKDVLTRCLSVLTAECRRLKITLNQKKLQIAKLTKGFVFLKHRFYQDRNGHVRRRTIRSTLTKCRTRLRKLARKWRQKKMDGNAFYQCYASMRGYMAKGEKPYALKEFDELYLKLLKRSEKNVCNQTKRKGDFHHRKTTVDYLPV